ncbi:DEAD/DEAH box helicase [Lactobacillus sp. DCY120]|uniref:3'-5' exonuclease DinG n=1 Tax=Bombilactobacillus apium TaxID=2675299 RepID=A0A850R0E3_9LACO|nr:helicase C-terminal domain-containing protein [Bombilactobacillus apium]NVY95820.1 DEAD/DEAH box helicase [Bombilactobacillus apium]
MKDKKYIVVDLETTGTKWREGDRIIQFAAVLIDQGQISGQYNFLINPQQDLTSRIQELTGITPKMLLDQPLFPEIAGQIKNLLQGRIFVAHNVNFDLPFLQAELQAAGQEIEPLGAVDTVELAQVLLPEAPSFKLTDLTRYLDIQHLNPHQADSDALATAQLFLYLQEQLKSLPQPTLALMDRFASGLIRQTGDLITDAAQSAPKKVLPTHLVLVHGLVLTRPRRHTPTTRISSYPQTVAAKKKLLEPLVNYRPQQAQLMDFIHQLLEQPTNIGLIDAPTGMGKTLGYLLPLSYYVDQGQAVVIATSTRLLQQQLVQEALPLLEQIRQQTYLTTVISSPQHYLDLDNFYHWLFLKTNQRSTELMKLRLLVWLTRTQTGDLGELNLTQYDQDWCHLVCSNGQRTQGKFYKYDFWQHLQLQAQQSQFLITNHAYLQKHLTDPLWQTAAVVIFDEANHLLDQTLEPQTQLKLGTLKNTLKKVSDLLYQQRQPLRQFLRNNSLKVWQANDLASFEAERNTWQQYLDQLQADLSSNYFKSLIPLNQRQQPLNLALRLEQITPKTQQRLQKLARSLQAVLLKLNPILTIYPTIAEGAPIEMQHLFYQLKLDYQVAWQQNQNLEAILASLSPWQQSPMGLIISQTNYQNWDTMQIATQTFVNQELLAQLQEPFSTCFFLGGSLSYQQSFANFRLQLGLSDQAASQELQLQRDYALDNCLQVYLPTDLSAPNKLTTETYVQDLVQALSLLVSTDLGRTLILFNSLTTLQAVAQKLRATPLNDRYELLVQGTHGSNARLKKRFALNRRAILLASQSFGEGLNLAPQALKLVIITRLPFDAPTNPLVQSKDNYWRQQGENPFLVETLPTATRRLKQQVGRLIRSPQDRGILIILDPRLQNSAYGPQIIQELNLPPVQQQTLLELRRLIKKQGQEDPHP